MIDNDRFVVPFSPAQAEFVQYDSDEMSMLGPGLALATAVRVAGAVDPVRLRSAVETVTRENEVLRVSLERSAAAMPRWKQVLNGSVDVRIDWPDLPPTAADGDAASACAADFQRGLSFDLEAPPLFRIAVYQLDESTSIVCLGMHHIISDAEALGIVMKKVWAAYDAGRTADAAAESLSWTQYCSALGGADMARAQAADEKFWSKFLAGDATENFPRGPVREEQYRGRAAAAVRQLGETFKADILGTARELGVIPAALAYVAFGRFLARHTENPEPVFRVTQSARVIPNLRNLAGLMLLIFPVRCGAADKPVAEQAASVYKHVLQANRHLRLPPGRLHELGKHPEYDARVGNTHVQFVCQYIPAEDYSESAGGLRIGHVANHTGGEDSWPCRWIQFNICPGTESNLVCKYDRGSFTPDFVEGLLDELTQELDLVVRPPLRVSSVG